MPQAERSGERLAVFDIGRFLACSAVILHHANTTLLHDRVIPFRYGQLGVEFFMTLSGYLLARPWFARSGRTWNTVDFFERRIARIYPAYAIAVLGVGVLIATGLGQQTIPVPVAALPWHIGAHLLLIHAFFPETFFSLVAPWWSMSLEWQYYLIFPLLLFLLRRYGALRAGGAALVASLAFRAFLIHALPEYPNLWIGVFAARLPEFLFGMLLASFPSPDPAWLRWKGPLLAFVAGAPLIATRNGLFGELGFQLAIFGVLLLLAGATAAVGRAAAEPSRKGRAVALLAYLGRASYSTYLIHTLAGKSLLKVVSSVITLRQESLAVALVFVAYFAFAHLTGVAYHEAIEKPSSRLMTRALERVHKPLANALGVAKDQ